ncbi:MAG: hypothetical protein WEA76_08090 [Acidimicrobiia bacterium]
MTADSTHARPNDVTIENGRAILDAFESDDPAVVGVLAKLTSEERPEAVRRMLGIGARAMVDTAVGLDLVALDQRVLQTIERATAVAETQVRAIVAEAEAVMRSSFDPDTRTSVMARAITEFEAVRSAIVDTVDPSRTDSHVAVLLRSLTSMLGPGGDLEARLAAALDPSSEDSGLNGFRRDVDRRFGELRDLLAEQRGRREESDAGTRKGFDFEDVIETRLRTLSRPIGAIVSRTSDVVGSVAGCLVGDFVVTLASGTVVVIETKNCSRIGLDGSGGILAELDRALSNRQASIAICVSATDAFPAEVGTFGVYGNRVLVVDDGEGTMIEVALRWATLLAATGDRAGGEFEIDRVLELTDRARRLVRTFSGHRRALTDSMESIGRAREGLDEMRRDLLVHIDEIEFELERGGKSLRAVSGQ